MKALKEQKRAYEKVRELEKKVAHLVPMVGEGLTKLELAYV